MVSHERNRIDGWWNFPERNTIDRDHKQQRRAPRSMSNGKHKTKSKALLGKEWRGKHSLQRNGTRVPKRSLDRAVVVIDRMTVFCCSYFPLTIFASSEGVSHSLRNLGALSGV